MTLHMRLFPEFTCELIRNFVINAERIVIIDYSFTFGGAERVFNLSFGSF